jgi:hypothetical protein
LLSKSDSCSRPSSPTLAAIDFTRSTTFKASAAAEVGKQPWRVLAVRMPSQ